MVVHVRNYSSVGRGRKILWNSPVHTASSVSQPGLPSETLYFFSMFLFPQNPKEGAGIRRTRSPGKSILGYIVNLRELWATWDLALKKEKRITERKMGKGETLILRSRCKNTKIRKEREREGRRKTLKNKNPSRKVLKKQNSIFILNPISSLCLVSMALSVAIPHVLSPISIWVLGWVLGLGPDAMNYQGEWNVAAWRFNSSVPKARD